MFADYNIIITVGPSLLNGDKLKRYNETLPCIFRVNGAHGEKQNISNLINTIRGTIPDARILLDMPGNKIRTCNIFQPIHLSKGESFILLDGQINYKYFYKKVRSGDAVTANDGKLKFEVVESNDKKIRFRSHSTGVLGNNKGLHLKGINEELPYLFDKDKDIIEIALQDKVDFLGLSYVRDREDIKKVKVLLGSSEVELMSKVEVMSAINNLDSILNEVNNIIIDRGDLLAEVGIIELPHYQEYIIQKAVHNKVNVYLATQFLKSMEDSPVPLISEVMDLHTTFKKMISGIQLSEETAIGKYPDECLDVLSDMLRFVFQNNWEYSVS